MLWLSSTNQPRGFLASLGIVLTAVQPSFFAVSGRHTGTYASSLLDVKTCSQFGGSRRTHFGRL